MHTLRIFPFLIQAAFLLIISGSFSLVLTNCRSGERESGTEGGDPARGESLHLVVDAGSSGTRFCLFRIQKSSGGSCQALSLSSPYNKCQKVKAANGLADLSTTDALGVIEKGLNQFPANIRSRIQAMALLGTGGFRRQSRGAQKKIIAKLNAGLRTKKIKLPLHIITGGMEGKLAWRAARQLGTDGPFAILETGGATVQLAAGPTFQKLQAKSVSAGLNDSYTKLQKEPGFAHCLPSASKSPRSYQLCRGLIENFVASTGFTRFARSRSLSLRSLPLYGVGAPWGAVFHFTGTDKVSPSDIDILGVNYCGMSESQLIQNGVDKRFAAKTCFLISHQSALLRATGAPLIHKGGESWPRGGAVTNQFFGGCKD